LIFFCSSGEVILALSFARAVLGCGKRAHALPRLRENIVLYIRPRKAINGKIFYQRCKPRRHADPKGAARTRTLLSVRQKPWADAHGE
jgi:hypothetical protein